MGGASGIGRFRAFWSEKLGHKRALSIGLCPDICHHSQICTAEGADAVIRLQNQLLNMHDLEILDWSWSSCILGDAPQKIEDVMG